MATMNLLQRRIDAKIVWYGPAQSGKTTNLTNIHQRLPAGFAGPLRKIDTVDERTLFFDFMPVKEIEVGGWAIRFHLYTVPGQADYQRTRRAILGGADGVVFVADASRMDENTASLTELEAHLAHYDRSLTTLPIVLQLNKLDLPTALPEPELASALNHGGWPVVPAIAVRGVGVREALGEIARAVARGL